VLRIPQRQQELPVRLQQRVLPALQLERQAQLPAALQQWKPWVVVLVQREQPVPQLEQPQHVEQLREPSQQVYRRRAVALPLPGQSAAS
jgi:hypothetical protein